MSNLDGTNQIKTDQVNIDYKFISNDGTNVTIKDHADGQGQFVPLQAETTSASENDVATKAYVDAAIDGINIQATCTAASTSNIDLTKDVENGDSLDNLIIFTNQLILIKDQIDATQNGIYIVNPGNSPVRYPAANMLANNVFYVEQGKTNKETFWKVIGSFTGPGGEPNYGVDQIHFSPVTVSPPTPVTTGTEVGEDDEKSLTYNLSYNSPATNLLGTIGPDHEVFGVQIKVTQAFNGSNPELSIGDDINGTGFIIDSNDIDLTVPGIYEDNIENNYTAITEIKAYFNPNGATQGSAMIWINLEN